MYLGCFVVLSGFIFDKVDIILRPMQALGVFTGITVVKVTILYSN